MKKLCECGCEEYTKWNKVNKDWNKFILGHNSRVMSAESIAKRVKANTGQKRSVETKAKLSEAKRNQSEETKRKIGDAHRGKIISTEMRKKLSLANIGKKHSEETKRKIAEGNRGKTVPLNSIIKIILSQAKLRTDGYCETWSDKEYKNDVRKSACDHCGMTKMMNLKLFGCNLSTHHTNGKKNCAPWEIDTLCNSCHAKADAKLRKLRKI